MSAELRRQYQMGELLGRGSFGEVHRGIARDGGKEVAIKTVTLKPKAAYMAEALDREIRVMQMIGGHQGVIQLYDTFKDDLCHMTHLVIELCCGRATCIPPPHASSPRLYCPVSHHSPNCVSGPDLSRVIHSRGALGEDEVRNLSWQLLDVVSFLHARNVIHRDIKPANLLLVEPLDVKNRDQRCQDVHLKLVDFGLSRLATTRTSLIPGNMKSLARRSLTMLDVEGEALTGRSGATMSTATSSSATISSTSSLSSSYESSGSVGMSIDAPDTADGNGDGGERGGYNSSEGGRLRKVRGSANRLSLRGRELRSRSLPSHPSCDIRRYAIRSP